MFRLKQETLYSNQEALDISDGEQNSESDNPGAPILSCVVCGHNELTTEQLELHICSDHLVWTPYQCRICDNGVCMPTDHAVRTHFRQQHAEQPLEVMHTIDNGKAEALKSLLEISVKHSFNQQNEQQSDYTTGLFTASSSCGQTTQNALLLAGIGGLLEKYRWTLGRNDGTNSWRNELFMSAIRAATEAPPLTTPHRHVLADSPAGSGGVKKPRLTTGAGESNTLKLGIGLPQPPSQITDHHNLLSSPSRTESQGHSAASVKQHSMPKRLSRASVTPTPIGQQPPQEIKKSARIANLVISKEEVQQNERNKAPFESSLKTPARVESTSRAEPQRKACLSTDVKRSFKTCQVCSVEIDKKNMRSHVVRTHIKKYLLMCSEAKCGYGVYKEKSQLMGHIAREHDGKANVVNMATEYANEIEEWYAQCFPDVKPVMQVPDDYDPTSAVKNIRKRRNTDLEDGSPNSDIVLN